MISYEWSRLTDTQLPAFVPQVVEPLICFEGISKTYQVKRGHPVQAVRDVTLQVGKGEFVIITGRSGSGKTTLLNLAGGLARPSAGRVLIGDVDLWRLSDQEQARLRNRQIGFVFQFPSLLPSLTTLENVVLPLSFGDGGAPAEAQARARDLLSLVGLDDKLDALPRQLSGGQQQRVVIARSLINRPQILLADEPTSDLDEHTEHEIMSLFAQLHAETGITILLVTHARELVRYGTRALEMVAGAVVGDRDPGSPAP